MSPQENASLITLLCF